MKKIENKLKNSLTKIFSIIRLASAVSTNCYCKILNGLYPNIQPKKIIK